MAGFITHAVERPGNGPVASAWSVACHCGSPRGRLVGRPWPGITQHVPPLVFACASCGARTDVLDSSRHGYGGELRGDDGFRAAAANGAVTFACPGCSAEVVEVTCVFVVPDGAFDLIEDDELEQTGFGHGANVENLFDQFAANCTCVACGAPSVAVNVELK